MKLNQQIDSKRIEPALFDGLRKVIPSIDSLLVTDLQQIQNNTSALQKYMDDLSLAKDAILLFMRTIYRQFFLYGYSIDFDKLDAAAMEKINGIRTGPSPVKPMAMILSAGDFSTNVSEDLPVAGYGGGDRFVLKGAYCSSLYNLLKALLTDGKGIIQNYDEISAQSNRLMSEIEASCQKAI